MRLPCCRYRSIRWTMVVFSLDHGQHIVGPRLRYRWTQVEISLDPGPTISCSFRNRLYYTIILFKQKGNGLN